MVRLVVLLSRDRANFSNWRCEINGLVQIKWIVVCWSKVYWAMWELCLQVVRHLKADLIKRSPWNEPKHFERTELCSIVQLRVNIVNARSSLSELAITSFLANQIHLIYCLRTLSVKVIQLASKLMELVGWNCLVCQSFGKDWHVESYSRLAEF